jgi:predicted RNase H-like nuclease (RuvC/YqgF family)
MDEATTQLTASAERLASAAEALSSALTRLDEQQQTLNAKVERIVAAIDEDERSGAELQQLRDRVAELERTNAELKAQAARTDTQHATRKTLPPLVSALLAKNGIADTAAIDSELLDKTLATLSLEQRIAVKAEMARAGLIG